MKITDFCIKRPITTAMFFLALGVLGILSSSKMPIDLFPQITYPAINVSTSYSGAGPEEIEQLITIPIEQAVSGVNQVKSITSTSQEGSSRVTVNFNWGLNLDEATNDIRAALDRVKSRLPDDADIPAIFKYDPSQSPVMTIGLSSTRLDAGSLRKLADDELSYQLQKVNGVARVDVRGGQSEEIQVHLKQDRLQALEIAADQVATVLSNENSMEPAGHLAVGVGDFLLRTQGQFQSLDEIRNIVVTTRNNIPVYLKDLATVEPGYATTTAYVRIDGKPGIQISVQKRSGFNTIAVADGMYRAIESLQRAYPQISLRVLNDDSIYIRRAVHSVSREAMIGGVMAALILLFFFHNIRATLIIGVAMPVSIVITLMLAYFSNMSLNTFSLGGLALGVGMLVDNAVVVLDNIFRHYHKNRDGLAAAALSGTSEMGPAISASTLTHICVFFPLLYIAGRSGIIFKELSFIVIFSILCSLLVAVTLIPMLCAKFLRGRDLDSESESRGLGGFLNRLQAGWENAYVRTLDWCLSHKGLVTGVCGLIFVATLALYPFIGTELVQATDEGVISVTMQLPTGTRLEETDHNSQNLEQQITKLVPELEHMEVSVGGRSGSSNSPNQSFLTLRLQRRDERKRTTQAIVDDLTAKLQISGARLRIYAQSSMRMFYGGSQFPVAVDIRGKDSALSQQAAVAIMDKLSQIPGLSNVNMSREEARPELTMRIDRKRAADLGLTAARIATAIQTNMDGDIATVYRVNGDETDVRVFLQESDRKSWQDLQRIMVPTSSGGAVQLSNVVQIVQTNGPVSIERKDQERNITVQASLSAGRDLAGAMQDVQEAVETLSLPPGVMVYYSGDYQEQQESARDMAVAILLSLLLVYMVMAAQFESFFDPFVIILAIPFALGGVLLTLLITDTNINSQVYLGLIMLGGIVVNNTIVLISYIRILIDQGMDLRDAVLNGAKSRLRPILITTATTALGLVPMALGLGEGSETQTPLARTVIGGLIFSTVLSLVLIPVIFISLESLLVRFKVRKAKPAVSVGVLVILLLAGMIFPGTARAAAQQLTLKEAIGLALQNGEDGKSIRQSRELAQSQYRETIGGKGVEVYSELTDTTPPSGRSSNDDSGLKITAAKSIPLANLQGVQSLSDQIAASNLKTNLLNADQLEQQLIYQVVTAYQKELSTGRDWQIAIKNLERTKAFYNEVQARSKLGFTTISDDTGAAAQLATAETNLNRSQQLYQLARLKLRQLLGLASETELELAPIEQASGALDLNDLNQRALKNRPDLKLGQEALTRAEINLKLAGLAKRLGINFNWNLQREHFESNLSLTNYSGSNPPGEWAVAGDASLVPVRFFDSGPDGEPEYGTLSVTVRWTFLDGKVREEREKQALLLRDQTRDALRKTEKNASYDLQDAYYSYLNQLDKVRSSQLQLTYNQTYYDSVQAKLRVGMATVKDVLDAQVVLNQSEIDCEQAKSDLYVYQVNLLRATGELRADQF
ncbi:CzcA family heavy metal efflux pump/hydrophobe/amphiphile efflux-1 (HAE1) family protein [Hydrogenispora ethanolica]|uniref:CzcA family heavy metal efflux pump/hydrophobe/amphiphile efflux-1 (HAE1) family protein n=1 Tax=Hydrogenispora ethanolica TaxID=1082276 RepID=A0A4R1QXA0_HYDET|nr:efflux RND transporter permease subunit [Hydrogenispora ethanolica]TCL56164.1 CzcA family heavy metal efflux pump/hydrophobe/amphiphile efflux-1 (HAE1) family protein [Hydrogenispora ethanolica]